jgi:hypothetical protein
MVTVKRSRELEEFAREGRRRFEAGDEAWFGETTAHGEVSSFGTAADEQSRGRDAVLALTIDQVREMNDAAGLDIGKTEEAEDDVEAYEAGDAGWIVTHSRFRAEAGCRYPPAMVSVRGRDESGSMPDSVMSSVSM